MDVGVGVAVKKRSVYYATAMTSYLVTADGSAGGVGGGVLE